MFRVLAIIVVIAALTAQSAFAHFAPGDSGPAQRAFHAAPSVCDQLDARLGPKYVPFQSWSHC